MGREVLYFTMIIEANIYYLSNPENVQIKAGFHCELKTEEFRVKCDVQLVDKKTLDPGNWAKAKIIINEIPETMYWNMRNDTQFNLVDGKRTVAYGETERLSDF